MKLGDVLKELLVDETERRNEWPRHFGFHDASHPCMRKLYLDQTVGAGNTHDLRSVFAATTGSAIGDIVERAARRIGAQSQVPVILNTGKPVSATGTADLYDSASSTVADIKVVGESAWARLEKTNYGMPHHITQVNGYAAALRAANWSLWYLRGASIFMPGELQWRVFNGKTNKPQAEHVNDRWTTLKVFLDAKKMPPVPGGYSKDRFPCGWCGHRDFCFPDKGG